VLSGLLAVAGMAAGLYKLPGGKPRMVGSALNPNSGTILV